MQIDIPLPERLQVTITEAAYMLSVDIRTVQRLLVRGDLDSTGHGRGRRIPTASIRDYVEQNRRSNAKSTY